MLVVISALTGTVAGVAVAVLGDVLYRVNAGESTLSATDSGPDWVDDAQYLATGDSQTASNPTPNSIDGSVPDSVPAGVWTTERYNLVGDGTELPGSGGETISLQELQQLINMWATGAPVGDSDTS